MSDAGARTIQVGVVRLTSDIPVYLAEKKGYFREEGLDVALVPFVSGAKMVASLGSGELDVGAGATSVGFYNAVARGLVLKIVADKGTIALHYSYKAIMVRNDLASAFHSLADLRGKKVGIIAVGAADESVIHQALLRGGLEDKDIDRVYLSFAQQVVAFSNKAIDAALGAEPDITQMLRAKEAVRFAPVESFYPGEQTSVLLYGDALVHDHTMGVKFMRAYLRGVRDYVSTLQGGKITGPGADQMIAELSAMTGIKDQSIFREAVPPYIDPNGRVNVASLQTDLNYFQEYDHVPASVQLSSVLDESYAQEATASLPAFAHPP